MSQFQWVGTHFRNSAYQLLATSLVLACVFTLFLVKFAQPPNPAAAASKPGDGVLFYSNSGNTTPQSRQLSNGASPSWTSAANAGAANGVGSAARMRASPTKKEAIAGYITSTGVLQILCYNGATWSNEWSVSVGSNTTRRFDIAYETQSGDVMVLYSTDLTSSNEMAYRTKPGGSFCGSANWSSAVNYNTLRSSYQVQWVKFAWDRRSTSNRLAAIWADNGGKHRRHYSPWLYFCRRVEWNRLGSGARKRIYEQ